MDQDTKAFLEEKFASVDRRFDNIEKVFDQSDQPQSRSVNAPVENRLYAMTPFG
jgi:hypothetical protein